MYTSTFDVPVIISSKQGRLARRELIKAVQPRWLRTGKVEKQKRKDEFTWVTASLDPITEVRELDILFRSLPGRTTLLITHRFVRPGRLDVIPARTTAPSRPTAAMQN